MSAVKGCYLIHFDRSYRHARHYLGWAADVDRRFDEHRKGAGARLTQVVVEHGIGLELARVWDGQGRTFERRLKNGKNAPRLCPVCRAINRQATSDKERRKAS